MPRLRLAERMAALSLATDLGMGQPLEQALRTCLIAIELAARMGLDKGEISEVFYVALLRFIGCTVDAHDVAELFGGDDIAARRDAATVLGGSPLELARELLHVSAGQGPARRVQMMARLPGTLPRAAEARREHCEMAAHLALRLELPAGVQHSLGDEDVRWDGLFASKGFSRDGIPISGRIVLVAREAEVLHREGGMERVRLALKARRGHSYDPTVASVMLQHTNEVMAAIDVTSPWQAVLEREPEPYPWVPESRLESVLETFADFVDMKSPCMAGHSRGVAALAGLAWPGDKDLRRAGLVHDLGRVNVPNGIWTSLVH